MFLIYRGFWISVGRELYMSKPRLLKIAMTSISLKLRSVSSPCDQEVSIPWKEFHVRARLALD